MGVEIQEGLGSRERVAAWSWGRMQPEVGLGSGGSKRPFPKLPKGLGPELRAKKM